MPFPYELDRENLLFVIIIFLNVNVLVGNLRVILPYLMLNLKIFFLRVNVLYKPVDFHSRDGSLTNRCYNATSRDGSLISILSGPKTTTTSKALTLLEWITQEDTTYYFTPTEETVIAMQYLMSLVMTPTYAADEQWQYFIDFIPSNNAPNLV
ncbi:hypothetical protein BC829DRAFT_412818 [Chytridium lagenaria]|nr:hypothetical protein BC829DRAFT_412818 [Chytridium lagenaria]